MVRFRHSFALDPELERVGRRAARRRGTVLGLAFVEACVSGNLRRYLDEPDVAKLVEIHDRLALRSTGFVSFSSFQRAGLAALRRQARKLSQSSQDSVVMAMATLWFVLKHRRQPTGHEILERVAAWQA